MAITIMFILSLISSTDIRWKVRKIWNNAPTYFFHDAASSSGKYHPDFDLGDGGVMRHSLLVAYFAHEIATAWGMTQREIDCAVAAGLLHDILKRGVNGGENTVHEHPLLAAKFIRDFFAGDDDMKLVANAIESHMGKWTTSKYSDVVLPVPETKIQLCVSAADMTASRKVLSELGKASCWEV